MSAAQTLSPAPCGGSESLPAHIAIIMDGNGRWASERKLPRVQGHRAGAEALRGILNGCAERPFITHLTLYAFSTENWQRSPEEVADLMNLLRHYVKREALSLHKNGVCLRFIGERESLAQDIQRDLAEVEAMTKANTKLTVTLALSYGARQEITRATQAIAASVARGELAANAIDAATLTAHLNTHGMPDPDLLIRTGGEHRLSNFLLWQSAYAELYFTDILWPDFTPTNLDAAVEDFSRRERRFGKRKAP